MSDSGNTQARILVADDNEAILDSVALVLREFGYAVETVQDAHAVAAAVRTMPALVLLDLWMSGINGKDICRALKADSETRAVPVVIMSANKDTAEIAAEVGADGHILKPFGMRELREVVSRYVHHS